MVKNMKVLTTTVIATSMLAVLIAGCGGKEEPKKEAGTTPGNSGGAASSADVKYPDSLTYWVSLNANAGATMKSYGEIAAYKELEKRTGTKVEFQHPPTGQEKDQFNLMIASGKLPDVIEYTWGSAPKGADSLIKEKRIIRLNELIEKNAPNLTKVLKDNPEFRKLITTDEGNIYVMPFLLGDEMLKVVHGPVLRKDWLDKLNLKMPTTLSEWETVLTAFRDQDPNGNNKKDEIPYYFSIDDLDTNHLFVGAWGIASGFYNENGKIKYGPIEPQFKEFLATMAKWYKDGLIDKDYATTDAKLKDAKVTNNQLGSLSTYPGSGISRYTLLAKSTTPSFQLVGAPYPGLKAGDKPLGQYTMPFTGVGAAISASAKNPEQIVKWLDYKYGQEGHLLFNFGIEGQSYKMENGYPKYTDVIMNNPDKLPITQAMAKYFIASWSGPIVQDKRYIEQYFTMPEQREAAQTWAKAEHSKTMPPITLTAEESSKTSSIMNDVKTYRDEMINKFIMGSEPIANFDKFVATIKSMGIDEAIKARQAALDRFNNRK
ncbi:extracellular solute-binding protein [Paenibacillus mesophilus]|uniref:extracellular solute-binding protein n=1 Tax=Paenibacillus mesophilus TaxID=2582849 RepID=UPI00110E4A20|nr:extracellular solute-binding protein [Paenibacillus mesophilus]TMV48152.1 extracellular solute-binding protein [Paenibacillus mesophilus]